MRISVSSLAIGIATLSLACQAGLAQELSDVVRQYYLKDTVLLCSANIEAVLEQSDLASRSALLQRSKLIEGDSPFRIGETTRIVKLIGADLDKPMPGQETLDLDFPVVTFVEYQNDIDTVAFAEYMNRFQLHTFLSSPKYIEEHVGEHTLFSRVFADTREQIASGILDPSYFLPTTDKVVFGPRNIIVSILQNLAATESQELDADNEMESVPVFLLLRNGGRFGETRMSKAEFCVEGRIASAFKRQLPLSAITNAKVIIDFEKLIAFTADIEFVSEDDAEQFEQWFNTQRHQIVKQALHELRPVWQVAGSEEKKELDKFGELLERCCSQLTVARDDANVTIHLEDNELVRITVFHALATMAFWHSAKFASR